MILSSLAFFRSHSAGKKILELQEAGQSVPQIAKEVGVSVATVYRTVGECGENGVVDG
jgi:transposase